MKSLLFKLIVLLLLVLGVFGCEEYPINNWIFHEQCEVLEVSYDNPTYVSTMQCGENQIDYSTLERRFNPGDNVEATFFFVKESVSGYGFYRLSGILIQ